MTICLHIVHWPVKTFATVYHIILKPWFIIIGLLVFFGLITICFQILLDPYFISISIETYAIHNFSTFKSIFHYLQKFFLPGGSTEVGPALTVVVLQLLIILLKFFFFFLSLSNLFGCVPYILLCHLSGQF